MQTSCITLVNVWEVLMACEHILPGEVLVESGVYLPSVAQTAFSLYLAEVNNSGPSNSSVFNRCPLNSAGFFFLAKSILDKSFVPEFSVTSSF